MDEGMIDSGMYICGWLIDWIMIFLGGCVVEEEIFGLLEIIVGVVNDIRNVVNLVCEMVICYGMFELGFLVLENLSGEVFLGRGW